MVSWSVGFNDKEPSAGTPWSKGLSKGRGNIFQGSRAFLQKGRASIQTLMRLYSLVASLFDMRGRNKKRKES